MDLNTLDPTAGSNQGFELHLKHPDTMEPLYADNDPRKPVTITVLGANSDKYKEITDGIKSRSTVRAMKARGNVEKMGDVAVMERENLLRLARTTLGWKNLAIDGREECNEANCLYLYERLEWVRDQAIAAQEEIGNFLPKSEPKSKSSQKPSSN